MDEHMGATYVLSVAIVVFVAIVLRQVDRPTEPGRVAQADKAVVERGSRKIAPRVSRTDPATASTSTTPRDAFTKVGPGESLKDVASRVYGTDRSADELWRANRDHLASPDEPLRGGMSLRTP